MLAACAPHVPAPAARGGPPLQLTYRNVRIPGSTVIVQPDGAFGGAVAATDIDRAPCAARPVAGTLANADGALVAAARAVVWRDRDRLGTPSPPAGFPSDSLTVATTTATPGEQVQVVREIWNGHDPDRTVDRALAPLRALIPCRPPR